MACKYIISCISPIRICWKYARSNNVWKLIVIMIDMTEYYLKEKLYDPLK